MSTKAYAEQVRVWRQVEPLPLFPVRARAPARVRPAPSLAAIIFRLTGYQIVYGLLLCSGIVNAGVGLFVLAWHFS